MLTPSTSVPAPPRRRSVFNGLILFPKMRKNKMIAIGICPLLCRLVSMIGRVVTQKDRKLLGEGIRKYRKIEGLTQEKLAEKVDLNIRNVQRIEAGQINILITTARRIKSVLGCSWDDLMGK